MKRRCKRCSTSKSTKEFYSRRGKPGSSSYCKLCTNQQSLDRQRALKEQAIEYKGGKCSICGYSRCRAALEFHHRDPSQKDFSLGRQKSTTFSKVKDELDKCDLLCSNCHREAHSNLQNCPVP